MYEPLPYVVAKLGIEAKTAVMSSIGRGHGGLNKKRLLGSPMYR